MNAHRTGILALAVTLAVVPAAVAANPPHGSHGQESDPPARETLHLHAVPTARSSTATIVMIARALPTVLADSDHAGSGRAGDYQVARQVLLTPGGAKLGRTSGLCSRMNATGTQIQCRQETRLAGGSIMTAGTLSVGSRTSVFAVMGGTGIYAGSAGTVRETWLDAKRSHARLVFSLHR